MAFLRLRISCVRSSGRAPNAPKHPRARPIHLSSLYEILFRPENNTIAPLTNIAPPAAGITGKPRLGAAARNASINLLPPPVIPPGTNPKIPQPTNTVPMAKVSFTKASCSRTRARFSLH